MLKRLIVLFFLLNGIIFCDLNIIKQFEVEVSVDRKGLAKAFYLDPPIYIYEGFNNELIIPQYVFFEVFSAEGKKLGKIGDRGEGPGDFINIVKLEKYSGYYMIQDFPNKIVFFDRKFKFMKRLILLAPKSNINITYFDIANDKIYCAQKSEIEERIDHCINVYDLKGIFIKSYFDMKAGREILPNDAFLGGRIVYLKNRVFYSFAVIPRIWQINDEGTVINMREIGKSWWQKIQYDQKKFKKEKNKNIHSAFAKILLTGDRIFRFWKWNENLIIQVLRKKNEDFTNLFIVLNPELNRESELISYKDYQFCGAGKYIYFSKENEEIKKRDSMVIKVVQCDYEF